MAENETAKDMENITERERKLLNEKHKSEVAFGQQRTKFMELFKQKEEELLSVKESNQKLVTKNAELQKEIKTLLIRTDELKSESMILVVNKEDEIARLVQRHQDEAASFQQILKESVAQAYDKASSKYEEERSHWLKMEHEYYELKSKNFSESEGSTLSNLARNLQKKMHLLTKEEPEGTESSVVKAQEDIELLRSVVSPLEDEIKALKKELQCKTEELSKYIKQSKGSQAEQHFDVKKNKELNESMQSERASRTDLEMYVSVLNIQKEALYNDYASIKLNLSKAEALLEREVSRTSLLQERIDELEDAVNSVLQGLSQQTDGELLEWRESMNKMQELLQGTVDSRIAWIERLENLKVKSPSISSVTSASTDVFDESSQLESQEQASKSSPNASSSHKKSQEEKSPSKQPEPADTLDWRSIQDEMDVAREKLGGRQCKKCEEANEELKAEREEVKKSKNESITMVKLLDQERQVVTKKDQYIKELETNLQTVMENSDGKISLLSNKLVEAEKFMRSFRDQFERGKLELSDYLQNLGADRQSIQKELNRLQTENDSLVEKHARKAQEMQEEIINLPNNLEDMQLMLLKYREELITCRVSLEHTRESMSGEVSFLKSRLEAEQQERVVMEDTLTQELSQLQNQLDNQRQLGEELEKEKARRLEEEKRKSAAEEELRFKEKVIENQQFECKQLKSVKAKLDKTVLELNSKIHGLQVDLDNSEYVQRDFVKLSQTLQIQLEKIRAGETEVRWQHEEDVSECPKCKIPLSSSNNKIHCRHCGHIFCNTCLSKTVASGPSMKPSRVCDVCHTMLVKSATPFFSQDSRTSHNHKISNHNH